MSLLSASVVGVDRDVGVRQVASPDRRRGVSNPSIDADQNVAILHVGRRGLFVILLGALAVARNAMRAEPDRELVAVCGFARFADGHDDAAPIWILPRDSRLEDRRVGAGEPDFASSRPRFGTRDLESHELRKSFSVLR